MLTSMWTSGRDKKTGQAVFVPPRPAVELENVRYRLFDKVL